MGIYKKLFSYAPERKGMAYVSIFFSLVSVVLLIMPFWYLWIFLRRLLVEQDTGGVMESAVFMILFMLAYGFTYFAALWFSHILAFRLENNLRKLAVDHLLDASFSYFDLHASGRIRKVIDNNASETHTIVAHLIPDISSAVLFPILVIAVTFVVDYRLGILLVVLMVIGMGMISGMLGESTFMEYYMQALERMNGEGVEYIRGIQVVKLFGTEVQNFKAFYAAISDYAKNALEYSMSSRIPYVLFQILFNIIVILPLPVCAYLLGRGGEPGLLLAKVIFFACLSGAVFTCFLKIMYTGMYQFQAKTVLERLEEAFEDMKKKRLVHGTAERMEGHSIEFDRVHFSYDEEKILEDLSFRLEEGKTYALVGSSGGGKSTIARLISGFYPIDGGEIRIGGRNISLYSEKALTENIAFVFQHSRLFKTSIYENVRMARPEAPHEEVMQALLDARCGEILERFPDKENTIIGSKGVYLSGGETQRIAIARAILKDAPIIILDEASAAADPENEYELQRAFARLIKGKTVIMIAHRLSSIKNVDEILVVDGGKVVQRGNHGTLMKEEGQYKRLQEMFERACDWRIHD